LTSRRAGRRAAAAAAPKPAEPAPADAPVEMEPAPVEPTKFTDLSELRSQLASSLPPPPPAPTTPPVSGAGAPGEDEGGEEVLAEELQEIASDPSKLDGLTKEELADLWELVFGLVADERGAHWEVDRKRALRLGDYTRKTLDQYGGIPESWAKHIPAIILAIMLGATVYRRVKIDRDLNNPPLVLHRGERPVAEPEVVS